MQKLITLMFTQVLFFATFAQIPTYEFQFTNPVFDCDANTVTYDIESQVDLLFDGATNIDMRIIVFDNQFGSSPITITDNYGAMASNFSVNTISNGSTDTIFGVYSALHYISGTFNHTFSSLDWETAATLTLPVNADLTTYFCPILLFDEDESNGLSYFPGSAGLVANVEGIVAITTPIQTNWIQFFPGYGVPNPTPVCITAPCGKSAKVRVWSEDGDMYVDNACYGLILTSPNGDCWRMTINDDGTNNFLKVDCP